MRIFNDKKESDPKAASMENKEFFLSYSLASVVSGLSLAVYALVATSTRW